MRQELILCDFCGEILYGKKGIADVRKDYVNFIPNKITFEKYLGKDWRSQDMRGEYDWGYVQKKVGQEFTFCNGDCLSDWLKLALKPENLKWQSDIDEKKDMLARGEQLNYPEQPMVPYMVPYKATAKAAGIKEGFTPRKSFDADDFKYNDGIRK